MFSVSDLKLDVDLCIDKCTREQPDGAEPTTGKAVGDPTPTSPDIFPTADNSKDADKHSGLHHHHHHYYHLYRQHATQHESGNPPSPCPVHGSSPHSPFNKHLLTSPDERLTTPIESPYLCPVHGNTVKSVEESHVAPKEGTSKRHQHHQAFDNQHKKTDLSDIEEVPEPIIDYSDDGSCHSSLRRSYHREPTPDYSSAERLYKHLKAKLSFRRQLNTSREKSPHSEATEVQAPPTPSVDYSSCDSLTSGDESSWMSSTEDDSASTSVAVNFNPSCAIHGRDPYFRGVHFAEQQQFDRSNIKYASARNPHRNMLYSKFYTPSFSPILEEEERKLTPTGQKNINAKDSRNFNINAYVYTINSNVYSVGQSSKDDRLSRTTTSRQSVSQTTHLSVRV